MGRREDLLRQEAEGWERIAVPVDGLSPDQLERSGLTPDGWSIKDLLWHLAVWYEDAARTLDLMRTGTWTGDSMETGRTERVNREALAHSRTMRLEDARAAWRTQRRRMLEAFGAFDDAGPTAEEWFDEAGPSHYAEHLDDLEAWVARLLAED